MIWWYRYKYNLVQWPVIPGFSFLFDIMQLGTRSLRPPDKVIFFPKVLHVLDYDNNSTVSDDDDDDDVDDLEVMMMVLMF